MTGTWQMPGQELPRRKPGRMAEQSQAEGNAIYKES